MLQDSLFRSAHCRRRIISDTIARYADPSLSPRINVSRRVTELGELEVDFQKQLGN